MSIVLSAIEVLTRTTGDVLHVMSMLVLMLKIRRTKSCSGVSLKSQVLYMLVYMLRYADIVYIVLYPERMLKTTRMLYNNILKIVYISLQSHIIYMMTKMYYYSYDAEFDQGLFWISIGFSAVSGWFLASFPKTKEYVVLKYIVNWLYTSSVVLEAASIVPQLYLLNNIGEGESLTIHYVMFLGLYRIMYIVAWMIKLLNGKEVSSVLIWGSVIQAVLYSDFFYTYMKYFAAKKKSFRIYPRMFLREAFRGE